MKIIKPFALPPTLIAIGMAATLILLVRKKTRLAKYVLLFVFLAYYLLSIEPTAFFLERSLAPRNIVSSEALLETFKDKPPEVIVVLAGGASPKDDNHPFAELSGASWKRLWRGIEIFHQLDGKTPILYSGDSGDPFGPRSDEALLAREYAVLTGVPKELFWVETDSRTTAESGVAINQMLNERFPDHPNHRVILVTSSWHIPRASATFGRKGIDIIPAPADFPAALKLRINPLSFTPSVEHFASSYFVIHEWIGMGFYWTFDLLYRA